MASSKLMSSSTTSTNSDLIRRKSSSASSSTPKSSTNHHHHRTVRSLLSLSADDNDYNSHPMTVDGLLRNVYEDDGDNHNHQGGASGSTLLDAEITFLDAAGAITPITGNEPNVTIRRQESVRTSNGGQKTVDDVWKEIVAGRRCKQEAPDEMMTLEDFLAKAGAVEEEDVKVIPPPPLPTASLSGGIFAFDTPIPPNVDSVMGFGVEEIGGRGKRRAIFEPLDKAAEQRQRRMIKNRESAARSRERKQAYQLELESLAVKLEEENAMLLKEKAERTKERFKQLMEKIIPVSEKRRPPRVLRKVRSMQW